MLNRLGPAKTVIAGLAIVIAIPALSLLTVRHGLGAAYTGSPLAVFYPAGTLVQPARPLPRFELIDEHGRSTSLARFRGRWLVIAPAATLCQETCPLTTAVLTTLTRDLRRDGLSRRVAVAEITVDPWRDSPARLRAYRQLTGANFPLLTGTTAEIHPLWSFLGVFYERVPERSPAAVDWMTHRSETFDVQHTDGVFIIDPAGRERIVEEGVAAPTGSLPKTVRELLDAEGRQDLAHPQEPWSAGELLADLGRLIGIHVRGATTRLATTSRATPTDAASPLPSNDPPTRPLRALEMIRAQGSRLLGGYGALMHRLERLRGLPVVLNAWASWCPPCRAELPIFATASRAYANRIAFLGVDTDDSAGAAKTLLADDRLPYPSYQASIGVLDSLAPIAGTPSTIFFDRAGQIAYIHQGQYASVRALEHDLDRYALGQR